MLWEERSALGAMLRICVVPKAVLIRRVIRKNLFRISGLGDRMKGINVGSFEYTVIYFWEHKNIQVSRKEGNRLDGCRAAKAA
jgi:hypothetical protein